MRHPPAGTPTFCSPQVPWAARTLAGVPHRVGLAVHAAPGAWALALTRAADGLVVAWDGWAGDQLTDAHTWPLADSTDGRWDAPGPWLSLAVVNGWWLAGPLLGRLAPHYDLARLAGDLMLARGSGLERARWVDAARQFAERPLVAYLPVVDDGAVLAWFDQHRPSGPDTGLVLTRRLVADASPWGPRQP